MANLVLVSVSVWVVNHLSAYSKAQQYIDIWLLVPSRKQEYEPDKIEAKI
jgi:hypothetical protein